MAGNGIHLIWNDFKSEILNKNLPFKYIEKDRIYRLYSFDGIFQYNAAIEKTSPVNVSQEDFETNYKSTAVNALGVPKYQESDGRMLVSGEESNPSSTPGSCVISNKLRFDHNDSDRTADANYSSAYSYIGSGKLFGFTLDYNSDYVWVKLTIDGTETIFELTLQQIEDLQAYSSGGCDDSSNTTEGLCGFLKKASGNRLYFKPPCAITYDSEVKIEHKRSTSSSKTLTASLVILTKET